MSWSWCGIRCLRSPLVKSLANRLKFHPGLLSPPRLLHGYYEEPYAMQHMFDLLYYAHQAGVILDGHNHDYEQRAPVDTYSEFDPKGRRLFVIGAREVAVKLTKVALLGRMRCLRWPLSLPVGVFLTSSHRCI